MKKRYVLILFLQFCIGNLIAKHTNSPISSKLVICGDNQVLIFDLNQSEDSIPHIIWRWKASEAFDLPPAYRSSYFRSLDDCKPVDGGSKILLTSSSGGVALVEVASKKTLFYAYVGNAHSAEMLPGGRLVVAGSTNEKGNRIELFDIAQSEIPLFRDSLYSAHGVVWDKNRELLYALGYDELRAYQLKNWESDRPELTRVNSWKIPGESGHDLVDNPLDEDELILTEHESVWVFNKKTEAFSPFEPLENEEDVKAVNIHPLTGKMAYVQAEINWWSHRVYIQGPDQYFSFPGIDMYKARWMPAGAMGGVIQILKELRDPKSEKVFVAAHRGDWFWAPENSLAAFRNCIEAGVDIIEIDVRLSKDGIPVIIHDLTLDRTTTGSGKVEDYTLKELKSFYLKDAAAVITTERIPTLEEVLELSKDRIIIYLDKSSDKVDKIIPYLEKTATLDQAMFVLDFPFEKAVEVFDAHLERVLFVPVIADGMENLDEYVDEYLSKLNPVAFQFRMETYDGGAYEQLGKVVNAESKAFVAATWPKHTIGHDDQISRTRPDDGWGWLIKKGFRVLETNRPFQLLTYLKKTGR